jgi:hypothetical protein
MTLGKGCIFIFGLPFAIVGLGSYFALWWILFEAYQASSWPTVPAQVLTSELSLTRDDDGSVTLKPKATYKYSFNGTEYIGERVGLVSMSDNFGSFQKQLAEKIDTYRQTQTPIDCYVNPSNPSNAVLNREVRYEYLVFFSFFALIFGVIGVALLVGALFTKIGDYPGVDSQGFLESSSSENPVIVVAAFLYALGLALPLAVLLPAEILGGHFPSAGFGAVLLIVFIFILRACFLARMQMLKFGKSKLQIKQLRLAEEGLLQGTVYTERSPETESLQLIAKLSCVEEKSDDDASVTLFKTEEKILCSCRSGSAVIIPLAFKFETPPKLRTKNIPPSVRFEIKISSAKGTSNKFETKFVIKNYVANNNIGI